MKVASKGELVVPGKLSPPFLCLADHWKSILQPKPSSERMLVNVDWAENIKGIDGSN